MLAARAISRLARVAAVEDQQMAQHGPLVLGEPRHEVTLNLCNVALVVSQPEPPGQAHNVRVHNHSLIDIKCIAKHHVGRLSCNPA